MNGLFRFIRHLLGLRNHHGCLRQAVFGDLSATSVGEVTFLFTGADGRSPVEPGDRALEWLIDGSAVGEDDFLLLVNMHHELRELRVPAAGGGREWRRIVDTARWAEPEGNAWDEAAAAVIAPESSYGVHPYCVTVLHAVPAR
ncbi:MAG TPA: hypothetical protein PLU22_05970 [Polyangiaceae bacterium]|nr:hypothetical protein [Polyangiaceae bacterium]